MNASKTAVWVMVAAALSGNAIAEGFTPPKSYSVSRYEAGWQKNPFTLKTAAVAVQKANFANDLTLSGISQAGGDITVILVNKVTREYIRLRTAEPASNAIKIKAAHLPGKHADTYVELENGNEVATVRYDDNFLKQMAAQTAAPQPVAQFNGANLKVQRPVTPPPGVTPPNITPQLGVAQLPQNPAPNRIELPPLPVVPGTQPNIPSVARRRLQTAPNPAPSH